MSSRDTEEIRQLRSALRQTQKELAVVSARNEELESEVRKLNRSLDGAWQQLDTLRHSTSWQITAPIRVAKSAVRSIIR